MRKKIKKRDIDKQLLHTIISIEAEWKQMRAVVDASIDPTENILHQVEAAQAKYMFLLREARHRRVSAIRY